MSSHDSFGYSVLKALNSHEVIRFFIVLFFLAGIIYFGGINVGRDEFCDLSTFVSLIIGGVLFLSCGYCLRLLRKWCERRFFKNLQEIYALQKECFFNFDNKIFPVIKCVDFCEKNYSIKIRDDKFKMYQPPVGINLFYSDLMKSFVGRKMNNNIMIRLDGFECSDGEVVLKTSRTKYYDSMITNRAMDYMRPDGLTNRMVFEPGPFLSDFESSLLSNHLGFNLFIETTENNGSGNLIFVRRRKDVSIGEGMLGCSVEASIKTKYALNLNGVLELEGIFESINKEIDDELKIRLTGNDKIGMQNMVCFYRDVREGGKPQFLLYKKVSHSFKEVKEYFEQRIKDKKERGNIDGVSLVYFDVNTIDKIDISNNKIKIKNKKYNTTPSSMACFIMIRNFLIEKKCL